MLMTRSGSPQPGTCMLAVSLEWTTATNGSFAFWRERVLSQTDECISGARTTYGTTRWRSTSATSTARTWCKFDQLFEHYQRKWRYFKLRGSSLALKSSASQL
jgi:hypothetical protein